MQHAAKSKSESFKEFMARSKRTSDEYVNGDPSPVDDIATHVSPVPTENAIRRERLWNQRHSRR
jgi:hypothetical protein